MDKSDALNYNLLVTGKQYAYFARQHSGLLIISLHMTNVMT
jgi:hypothetical protein